MIMKGWYSLSDKEAFKPHKQRESELSVEGGCVLWGNRVIIPSAGRPDVTRVLHNAHQGIIYLHTTCKNEYHW